MLLYLNSVEGGGETTFPVADNRTYEEEVGDHTISIVRTKSFCFHVE